MSGKSLIFFVAAIVGLIFLAVYVQNSGLNIFSLILGRPTEEVTLPLSNQNESEKSKAGGRTLEIVTLLSFDAIPAILEPRFVTSEEASKDYQSDDPVLGVSIKGEHRAYSIKMLSRHEIVNDVVGGVPIAITW